jgi:hypothetical protein
MKVLRLLPVVVSLVCALAAAAQVDKPFPAHWGAPPAVQTRDYRDLPGGYGKGSSTLARWITENLEKDSKAGGGAADATVKPLFAADFEKAALGKPTEEFLILDGDFTVKEEGGNKFLELPGAPLETFGALFGPTEPSGVAVTAQKRRSPTFAVGLTGVGGYKLQVAPGKAALELVKGEETLQTVPFKWESGAWTALRLQMRRVKEGEFVVEGRAWKHGGPEPKEWAITYAETKPQPGNALLGDADPFR